MGDPFSRYLVSFTLSFQAAREKLRNYIFDKTNVHNLLLYEVKRRGQTLEGLQRRLQFLKDVEAADKKCQKQMQVTRALLQGEDQRCKKDLLIVLG